MPGLSNDYSLERGLPASLDAERSILGAILLDSLLFDQATELTPDDFSLDGHRRIFKAMQDLSTMNITPDMITVANHLSGKREIEAVGGVSYLSSLIDGVPERPHIEHYVRIVRNKASLRGLIHVCENAIAEAIGHSNEAEEVLNRAEQEIAQLSEASVVDRPFSGIKDSIQSAGGIDNYLNTLVDPVALTGIRTGFVDLDELIRLRKQELTLLAARPSHGKTALMLGIAEHIVRADSDAVIPVFSLEMSRESLEQRLLQSVSRVSIRKIQQSGTPFFEDKHKLADAIGWLIDKNLLIDDSPRLTPARLRSKARRLQRQHGRLDLVIIDYIQLMSGGGKFENRTQEVSNISRNVKAAAKELDCPILALSLVGRDVDDRKDKRPMLSDLRETGQLEADADVVIFLFRPEIYDPSNHDLEGLCEVLVAKQRCGPTGECKLCYLAEYTRFENLAHGVGEIR